MTYSTAKMKQLYSCIENQLKDEDKKIVREMMSDYNKLIALAREFKNYLSKKEKDYAREMDENLKLKDKNKILKKENEILNNKVKDMGELLLEQHKEINALNKENQRINNILKACEETNE